MDPLTNPQVTPIPTPAPEPTPIQTPMSTFVPTPVSVPSSAPSFTPTPTLAPVQMPPSMPTPGPTPMSQQTFAPIGITPQAPKKNWMKKILLIILFLAFIVAGYYGYQIFLGAKQSATQNASMIPAPQAATQTTAPVVPSSDNASQTTQLPTEVTPQANNTQNQPIQPAQLLTVSALEKIGVQTGMIKLSTFFKNSDTAAIKSYLVTAGASDKADTLPTDKAQLQQAYTVIFAPLTPTLFSSPSTIWTKVNDSTITISGVPNKIASAGGACTYTAVKVNVAWYWFDFSCN